ncbi:MAG: hypothetical protein ABJG88_12710 [Litorimonas sp.]
MMKFSSKACANIIFAPMLWPNFAVRSFKILSIIFAVIIIHASLISAGSPNAIAHADKFFHALAYTALTGAIRLGWPVVWGGFIIMISTGLGIGLEFAQAAFAQGRMGSIWDALANLSGACIAIAALYPLRKRR